MHSCAYAQKPPISSARARFSNVNPLLVLRDLHHLSGECIGVWRAPSIVARKRLAGTSPDHHRLWRFPRAIFPAACAVRCHRFDVAGEPRPAP